MGEGLKIGGYPMIEKDLKGKVYLPEETKSLSIGELRKLLAEAGYHPNRLALWRAKQQGWFLVSGRKGRGRRASLGLIILTKEEMKLDARTLAAELGVHVTTAYKALRRGWVEVTSANLDSLRVPNDRIEPGDLPIP
jgi:hypothetical protein